MSYAPASLDLNGKRNQAASVRIGDDYSHPFTFVTDSDVAIDKSASTWLCQIRPSARSSTVLATFNVAVTGAGSNIVTISLTDTQTSALTPGNYVWDLQETAGGVTTTRLAGSAVVEHDVSRS